MSGIDEWASPVEWPWYKVHRDTAVYRIASIARTVPSMYGSTKRLKSVDLKPNPGGSYTFRNPNNGTQTNFKPWSLHDSAWVTGEPPITAAEETELLKRGG